MELRDHLTVIYDIKPDVVFDLESLYDEFK